jgi:hypothetical protein
MSTAEGTPIMLESPGTKGMSTTAESKRTQHNVMNAKNRREASHRRITNNRRDTNNGGNTRNSRDVNNSRALATVEHHISA